MTGQVCSSLTRIVVTRDASRRDGRRARRDASARCNVGDPFDEQTQMGPLAMQRQRDRVEGYIAKGVDEGATLAAGGGRPKHLDRGWFVEPTVFGNVDNASTIAQEEIFGPVLSVIPADDEHDAVRIANDTIYGLNCVGVHHRRRPRPRGRRPAARPARSATTRSAPTSASRSAGSSSPASAARAASRGCCRFLETKTVILDDAPSGRVVTS